MPIRGNLDRLGQDYVDTTPELERLSKAALDKLHQFRAALRDYKRAAKAPPQFLHDKIPVKMRADAFKTCQVFADRYAMMRTLATGAAGAEVGVQAGNFSQFMLKDLPVNPLHLLDLSINQIRQDVRDNPRVRLHGGDSSTNLRKLGQATLDWAYIDGDHSYQGALKDARAALHVVKPGGILFFNDYTMWSPGEAMAYGVVAVVNALVNEGHDMLAIALSPTGYFDVALRR